LTKASELQPAESLPKSLLAETWYRRDDFIRAAALFAAIGREAKARQLHSFQGKIPYQIDSPVPETRLKFLHTDPLPLVTVRVNDSEPVNFLIDTGGGEVILDSDFAKKIGVADFGNEQGTFAGNAKSEVGQGRANSLELGDWVVKNVPVNILSTRRFSAAARGKQVDGILGTTLLYHFIPTLDYRNGELILRRKTKEFTRRLERKTAGEGHPAVPFWLAGDHLMVAWGSVNQSRPMLMFLDTGLAGGGFVCPRSTLDDSGIKLPEGPALEGTGGAGKIKIVPFAVRELSIGSVKGTDIAGFFGPFPGNLEYGQGFRIGGLVSHQFFRPFSVTMDFTGMKLFFKDDSKKTSAALKKK
jgi:hypothetical protein